MTSTNSLALAGPGAARGRTGTGRAHGKVIALGEHAVVYGAPALAVPVPQLTATATATRLASGSGSGGEDDSEVSFALAGPGTASATPLAVDGLRHLVAQFKERADVTERVRVDVVIDCAVPQGRGLGSSAACARAAVLALADVFDRRLDPGAVFDLVQASEKVAHGNASGIDALATGATAPLLFQAGTAREVPGVWSGDGGGLFVIADSGVGGSTKEAVTLLRHRFARDPAAREAFVDGVSRLTRAALRDLAGGRLADFGSRLTENHRLLREVGISTDRIDALVDAALAAGSVGAKLTGGGLGGCMIALVTDARRAETVARCLRDRGAARTWVVAAGGSASHVR